MIRRVIILICLSVTLCGLTSCMTRLRRTYEGSTITLYLRHTGNLPDDAILDVYVDDVHTGQIEDINNPGKMLLPRGLHAFRVVSLKHNIEGSSKVFILGTGNAQSLRVDLKKITK